MTDRGGEFSFSQGIHVRYLKIWQTDTSIGFDSNKTNKAGTGDVIT